MPVVDADQALPLVPAMRRLAEATDGTVQLTHLVAVPDQVPLSDAPLYAAPGTEAAVETRAVPAGPAARGQPGAVLPRSGPGHPVPGPRRRRRPDPARLAGRDARGRPPLREHPGPRAVAGALRRRRDQAGHADAVRERARAGRGRSEQRPRAAGRGHARQRDPGRGDRAARAHPPQPCRSTSRRSSPACAGARRCRASATAARWWSARTRARSSCARRVPRTSWCSAPRRVGSAGCWPRACPRTSPARATDPWSSCGPLGRRRRMRPS
ncbi:MAG: hypothetical protein MZV70_37350 [Desulfobacterales bacterium]|nr:hypothetical protein [Desulfobacterales bacterium]